MPSANKATTPVTVDAPNIEGRYAELDDLTVAFETFPVDVDAAPYFAGLPDDRCQCDHWGYVVSGQVTFRWADHEETYVAGDAYVASPGHVPLITGGTEIIEFTRTSELAALQEVLGANMERMARQ
ncbi:cupin domain-containing protein [Gordonia sp. NPDC003376]